MTTHELKKGLQASAEYLSNRAKLTQDKSETEALCDIANICREAGELITRQEESISKLSVMAEVGQLVKDHYQDALLKYQDLLDKVREITERGVLLND